MLPETTQSWTAACATAVDSDWKLPNAALSGNDLESRPALQERKVRPIACAEVLLKYGETVDTEEALDRMLASMEPSQLGCGTADGAPILASMVRAWATDMVKGASTASQQHQLGSAATHGDLSAPTGMQVGPTPSTPQREGAIVSMDLSNACGRAYRSVCLKGLRRRVLALAGR